jgi:ATP-dependent Clp protease ATP-binding subunit ClpC
MVMAEVRRLFNPEFLNRLDEVIVFNALSDTDLVQILDLLVAQMNQNLEHKNISITLSREAGQWILEKTCEDRSYGARPLRRALQKYVEDPLSEALIQGEIQPPSVLEVVVESEGLSYRSMNDKLVAATPLSR